MTFGRRVFAACDVALVLGFSFVDGVTGFVSNQVVAHGEMLIGVVTPASPTWSWVRSLSQGYIMPERKEVEHLYLSPRH